MHQAGRSDVVIEDSASERRKENMGGLSKGLDTLLAFGRGARPDLTLSEVAELAGLNPATARRCLLTLQEKGFVSLNERRFSLTPKVLDLSAAFLDAVDIERLAMPYLTEIANQTGDAAALTVLQGRDILYLARTSARMLMRLEAHVGSRFPAYCTATGRVLLAGLTEAQLDEYLAGPLPAQTDLTVTDPEKLRRLIHATRRDGCSAVEDELAYGVISLAVPVTNGNGRIVAAINSSGHSKRIGIAQIVAERLDLLRRQAAEVSAQIARVPQVARMLVDGPGT